MVFSVITNVCVQKNENDANIQNVFQNVHLRCSCVANWKAYSEISEGFFRRNGRLLPKSAGFAHAKRSAASLTDFLELHLCLPELHL